MLIQSSVFFLLFCFFFSYGSFHSCTYFPFSFSLLSLSLARFTNLYTYLFYFLLRPIIVVNFFKYYFCFPGINNRGLTSSDSVSNSISLYITHTHTDSLFSFFFYLSILSFFSFVLSLSLSLFFFLWLFDLHAQHKREILAYLVCENQNHQCACISQDQQLLNHLKKTKNNPAM